MVSGFTSLSAVTLALLAASSSVDAHGTLAKPGLKFTGSGYGGNFATTVPMRGAIEPQPGDTFFNYPDANKNAAAFGRAFKASQWKSLKDFLMAKQTFNEGRDNMPRTLECGFTDPTTGPVQQLPDKIEWYGGAMNHPGPCEVWCDDEIVMPFNENCAANFPDGKFTYDKAKCVGKKRLTMYWMATLLQWQVYIDCAKIGEGGSAPSNNVTPSSGSTPAAAPKPANPSPAPAATTKAPSGSSGTVAGEAKTPSSSGSKCKRKLRPE